MKVIPAINIRNMRNLYAYNGNLGLDENYSNEPVFLAKLWEKKGAELLYFTDEDENKKGRLQNMIIIQRILEETKLQMLVGGGVKDNRVIRTLRNRGIDSVVIMVDEIENRKFIKNLCKTSNEKIIFNLRSEDGFLFSEETNEDKRVIQVVKTLEEYGASEVIYQTVDKKGNIIQPDFDELETFIAVSGIPVYVYTHFSTLDEIKRLKQFEEEGMKGLILDKPFYDGTFRYEEVKDILD